MTPVISDIRPEQLELAMQKASATWPCVCNGAREKESHILCPTCWEQIPEPKRRGLAQLDSSTEEYTLACEQILRIAERNLNPPTP